MRRTRFILGNLLYFRRAHAALLAGVLVGTATLTGALLVGDSVRESLRATVLGRLGRVQAALMAPRYFREELAEELRRGASGAAASWSGASFVPAILARGGVTKADSQARVDHIQILGVGSVFWTDVPATDSDSAAPMKDAFAGRVVALNEPLARELAAAVGDDVLVRLGSADPVSTETLLGRRDDRSTTLRLRVAAVLPNKGVGSFGLDARQATPRNAFVPLATLQRALDQEDRANAILVAQDAPDGSENRDDNVAPLQDTLGDVLALEDLGLTVRTDSSRGYDSLESDALLIDPAVENAAIRAGEAAGLRAAPVLTYLANEIRLAPKGTAEHAGTDTFIPYSTITAVDLAAALGPAMPHVAGSIETPIAGVDGIYLNQWAANDLGANVGDVVAVTFYVTDAFGSLRTESASFTLQGVLPMSESIADSGWTPPYKGITDTASLSEWNPPFPVDLRKVRPRDDEYWKLYKAAPKAFVSLATGRRLWVHDGDRFGASTAIRFTDTRAPEGGPASEARLQEALLRELDPAGLGFRLLSVRADALRAARGSTDFGMLFIGFSFFLVVSAAMLMALLFRLSVEHRAGEIGLLLAVGFSPRAVFALLVAEGAIVSVIGSALGVAGAAGYAWAMLAGLNSWWSAAVSGALLELHVPFQTLAIGGAAGVIVATLAQAWSLHGLTRRSPKALLAGNVESPHTLARGGRTPDPNSLADARGSAPIEACGPRIRPARGRVRAAVLLLAIMSAAVMALAPSLSPDFPATFAFFGSGASLLVVGLALVGRWLDRRPAIVHRPGHAALWRLGARNAPRHRGRSLLAAGLIASATFLIASLQAFQLRPPADPTDRASGTGGFSLVAEAAVPLAYDLNAVAGRESLGFSEDAQRALTGVNIVPMRLRPGEESSCLNLYRPTRPRVLAASDALIHRGGFAFASSLAHSPQERANPWLLLRRTFADGAIPVIADEAAVLWQLHSGLGKDIALIDERGRERRLRFVALLSQSCLQDEWIVSDAAFQNLFPGTGGTAFFLIDAPPDRAERIALALEQELNAYSFDAMSSGDRLARYLSVQNTYLATFQTLGGLGLVLGSCGLAVVMLRNVWERRAELALMRALGFSRSSLGVMVLSENAAVVAAGLFAGVLPAMLAVAPHLIRQPESIGWSRLALTILGVLIAGIGVGALALRPVLRAPLLRALRTE